MGGMYVFGGSRSSSGKRAGPTIYELNASGEGRSSREIPRLVGAGLVITWRAGRRELITMTALEVLSGIGVAAEVVVGRRGAAALPGAAHPALRPPRARPGFAPLAATRPVPALPGAWLA